MDKSEYTTTGVMTFGGNKALSVECPILTESRISKDLKLFGCRKMGFLEKNDVVLIVGKKGD